MAVAEPALDPRQQAAWHGFLRAHAALVDAVDRDLAAAGAVPLDWYDVLVALDEADGCHLRMGDLAGSVLLSKSGLTRLIDRIEAAGLVERRACPNDRRAVHVALTAAGREARGRAWPIYARAIAERFGRHLTCEEARAMDSAFVKMTGDGIESGTK